MGNGASLDLDPNISEEKLQKIAQVWELFFENAQKRVAAREAWLADPVGFNTRYNQVVTSPKNSNRRQAPVYSPGPRKEWRSKVLDDDVPSARSPSVRREKTRVHQKHQCSNTRSNGIPKQNAVFYEPHSYKGPARWKLPANAEIVGDRTAGWTRCWDDSNKAHFYRPPNGGTACWNARVLSKKHWMKPNSRSTSIRKAGGPMSCRESRARRSGSPAVYLTPSRGGAAWSTSGASAGTRTRRQVISPGTHHPTHTSRTGCASRRNHLITCMSRLRSSVGTGRGSAHEALC